VLQEAAQQWPNGCYFVILVSQYFLWYGILGTLFGSKLLWLTKLLRPLGIISQLLFGIPGGNTVLPGDKIPFAHSDEFIMVGLGAALASTEEMRVLGCCGACNPACHDHCTMNCCFSMLCDAALCCHFLLCDILP